MADTQPIQREESNWEYHNPAGVKFPIMASDPRPPYLGNVINSSNDGKPAVSEDDFKRLHECGFNLVRMITRDWSIKNSSINVHGDVDFDVTVADKYSKDIKEITYAIGEYKKIDHVKMFDFGDETPMDKMGETSVICSAYKDARGKITQLPIFNNGEEADKEENLNKLQESFHPAVWSYDCYPVLQKWDIKKMRRSDGEIYYVKVGPSESDQPHVYDEMYILLERYRNLAIRTKRPFWYYVQCMSYCDVAENMAVNSTATGTMRPVSEGYMRFSTFNALAYGAKGLRYWAFSLRVPEPKEAYFEAPIDLKNNPTEVYNWVKSVNEEVQALGSIFLHSDVSAVYHTGNILPDGTTRFPANFGPLLKLESGSAGLTVSFFTSKGREYMMLVNHDINNPQEINIHWKTLYTASQTADELAVKKHYVLSSRYVYAGDSLFRSRVDTIRLEACGYCIFSYGTNMVYNNPTGAEFPIIASQPCQEWVKPVTEAMFTGLKDCGFNLVRMNHKIWEPSSAGDFSAKTGVGLAVSGFSWKDTSSCLDVVRKYKEIDQVKAWDLYSDLAADPLANHIAQFAQTYNAVRELGTGSLVLWNVIGSTVSGKPEVLYELEELIRPSMWSDYTTTAFTQKCDSSGIPLSGSQPTMVGSYYNRLEQFLRLSKDSGRPFWHYVSCMSSHTVGTTFMVPVTEPVMRLAAFSGLAYGAKGMNWWGYAIRKSTSSVTYINAPIDSYGNMTRVWDSVKNINVRIREFGSIFLNSTRIAVYHTGDPIPEGTVKAPSSIGPFHTFKALGEGMLISMFSSLGKKYIMVVNRSCYRDQDFDVSCDEKATGLIPPLTGTPEMPMPLGRDTDSERTTAPEPDGGNYTKKRYRLEAGDFALFRYTNP